MKFTVEIELGNDAMQTGADVIKSIRESFKGEESVPFAFGEEGKLWDENGNIVGKWEASEGKTLGDFANTGKAFKRPHHALCYGFIETTGFLKEFDWPEGNGPITLARLTAEDLTATDWEEVK